MMTQSSRFDRAATLSVSILTRDSEARLGRLLREMSWIADEIIVGVDVQSSDQTEQIACELADKVFRFSHDGTLSSARMKVFDYATCDWIFVIDDDESIEVGLQELIKELLLTQILTHYWFSRKWIINESPYEYVFAPPWFPDWQLRLFRNDRQLTWKPSANHSGYHVMGAGAFEARASILHFEPVWCLPDARNEKIDRYRASGGVGSWENQYPISPNAPRRSASPPRYLPSRRAAAHVLDQKVHNPLPLDDGRWAFQIIGIEMVAGARNGTKVVAEIDVLNVGSLTWMPSWGIRSASIFFTHHIFSADEAILLWDCDRTLILAEARPGSSTKVFHQFDAPAEAGNYLLQWAMVSEGDRWFRRDGPVNVTPLHVV